MLRVAICITTHNRRAELERTVTRILSLSPSPDQILIAADGCADDTAAFVRTHAPDAVLAVHPSPLGSVASRNELAFASNCDIFISLDDDSYPIEPDSIDRVRTIFSDNPLLAVADFPQRTDEHPPSLNQPTFGPAQFRGTYVNAAAAIRRSVFVELGGYFSPFFHAYEEPDFALRCCAAGWQVRFEPCVSIRHHWTASQRNERRTHQRHARNEIWSVWLHCPALWLLPVSLLRAARQFSFAFKRGWALHEPKWWLAALSGIPMCLKSRKPIPWFTYRRWMALIRHPHDDLNRWQRDFGRRIPPDFSPPQDSR